MTSLSDASVTPVVLIVMGVSGSGKSTIGKRLAERLGWPYEDGDDLHPEENITKMTGGNPLTDADRALWLERVHERVQAYLEAGESAVIACSALKASYRSLIRGAYGRRVQFVYLDGSYDLIAERLADRDDHFMPATLLRSQFDALEEPEDAITVTIDQPPEAVVDDVVAQLGQVLTP